MRERISYAEEKRIARNRVYDLIVYMTYSPMNEEERDIYVSYIRRIIKRYGLKRELIEAGCDLSKVLGDDKK